MEKKHPLFVANWKMNKAFQDVRDFFEEHTVALKVLSDKAEIVICPSFIAIPTAAQASSLSHFKVGAQNCSAYESGAYTGQVDALSLYQAGCTYCIIGHSENREYENEDAALIGRKAARLIEHSLIPIICIGHGSQSDESDHIKDRIAEDLTPILNQIKKQPAFFCIAYEPAGSIGSGVVPSLEHIQEIAAYIRKLINSQELGQYARILYGGSVGPENAQIILSIKNIEGLLVGKSSLDFQKFKNIVL